MSLFLPPSKHTVLNLMAPRRRCLLRVTQRTLRGLRQRTKTHNFWLQFIVALLAAVANLHGKKLLATTARLLGEVIRLHVKLHPTALRLVSAGKICSMKLNKLVQFARSSEANILRFQGHLGMLLVRSSGANRRLGLGAAMHLWLAVRR